jgi:sarcosine oxidase subunit gamma
MSELSAVKRQVGADTLQTDTILDRWPNRSESVLRFTEVVGRGIVHIAGALKTFDAMPLPEAPNRCSARPGMLAACVGPQRWLLVGSSDDCERWLAMSRADVSIVDISSGRAIVRIEGPRWRELLARGCPLDSATVFPPGEWSSAQSLFCEINVLVLVPPSGQWAELFVPSSYRAFFWSLLEANAKTFGYEIAARIPLPIS